MKKLTNEMRKLTNVLLIKAILGCCVSSVYGQSVGVNVALNKPAIASASTSTEIPIYAFDGNLSTNWCAPGSLGWIKVDLQDKYKVDSIRLYVNQALTGNTVHQVKISDDMSNWTVVETLSGVTSNGQILTVRFSPALMNVRGVMINTTSSNSWVAWNEIEVFSIPTPTAETNLLTNAGAENNYDGWTKIDGGNGWRINTVGLDLIGTPRSGNNLWVSSYEFCTLIQDIDLLAAGFTESQLDVSPNIRAGAFIATNSRTGAYTTIKLELCDANGDMLSTHYVCNNINTPLNTSWTEKSHIISSYGTGVRKLKFYLIGKDDRWWLGHFGTQFDDAFVYVGSSVSTGIDKESSNAITVWPNPATDFIYLGENNGPVKIYDLKGSLVFSQNAVANERIDISKLQNGVYVLKTNNQNIKLVKK